jgi:hypothetical protein
VDHRRTADEGPFERTQVAHVGDDVRVGQIDAQYLVIHG